MKKIYILIKDTLDVGHAVNCAAHASLCMYLRHQDNPDVQDWAKNSFRKVSCKVSKKVFDRAKELVPHEIIIEKTLQDEECVLVTLPQEEFPELFKKIQLYGR